MTAECIATLYGKIKALSVSLFDAEQQCKHLQEEIRAKDKIIQDLHVDIYFSDLELQEVKHLVDTSADVNYMLDLRNQIAKLEKALTVLGAMEITM